MDTLYIWPDHPALSLCVVWLISVIFLWAAREPMVKLLTSIGSFADEGCRGMARWFSGAADRLAERSRASLLAGGQLDAQGKLDREFQRIDTTFSEKLGQYSKLHRKLDELLQKLEGDYQSCVEAPPEVPGWGAAVNTIAQIPATGDPNIQKVLEGIRKSSRDAEKQALHAYRQDTSKRHKILSRMSPFWKDIKGLMARVHDSVTKALESTTRITAYAEDYERIRTDQESAARALTYSATKLFLISLLVLGVALGGAFINFQLISLPMSELVPAGARIGGVPVSTVSALVIVLMETALGIFIMDMLGITDLFPKLASIPASRRRLILTLSLCGLFFLASVESSLAILREQIVEADAALKMALAGSENQLVTQVSSSMIPVVGQAVLGFVLPWILAMVAIPLELLIDSGRHVGTALLVLLLHAFAHAARILAHSAGSLMKILFHLYDVYIAIPVRIERMLRRDASSPATAGRAHKGRNEVTA